MRLWQKSPSCRPVVVLLGLATLLLLAAGCSGNAVPGTPADVTGPVLEVSASDTGAPGSFLIEEYEGDTLATAAWVRIDDATTILVRSGGEDRKGTASDIGLGIQVQVWFEGPVAESWPLQATAGTVLVLE